MLANTRPVHARRRSSGRRRSRRRQPAARARASRRDGRLYVGPDNGLLVPAAKRAGIAAAHELANPEYALDSVSRTFHGRDLFSPAAAHLALGVALDELGPPIAVDALVRLDLPEPEIGQTRIGASILYVDNFGNIALNLTREHVDRRRHRAGDARRARARRRARITRPPPARSPTLVRATSSSTRTATGTCRSRSAAAALPRCCTREPVSRCGSTSSSRRRRRQRSGLSHSPAQGRSRHGITGPDVLSLSGPWNRTVSGESRT